MKWKTINQLSGTIAADLACHLPLLVKQEVVKCQDEYGEW